MTINDTLQGFRLLRVVPIGELNAELYELEHEKTGLKLVWLKRDEENKTFGIAFTTLPWNDTGVFHILEHSVLCGSQRFPVKEPFVELLKTSMNTFLNALTFADKTVYPVSSRNSKDFVNLVRVYLDAVFCPAIYEKPEIFLQEGWHYELDENGTPSYKGVVFNEMKGAFADADELMDNEIGRTLFPDTPYRFVSGGDPACIPDLSYEEFLQGHRTYYSPSNAYVFLDGDLNLAEMLEILNTEYLCRFARTERIAPPALQAPVDGGVKTVIYELSPEESEEGHTRLGMAGVIGDYSQVEKLIAMQLLAEVLCGSNQAPLTHAVLEQGLAENVSLSIRDGIAQSWYCIEARNLKEENLDTVRTLIRDTLQRLADEGLDRRELEAVIANLEFRMRERDYGSYPQGLVYGFTMLESWLYGGAPEAMLEVGTLFAAMRRHLDEGYYEALIREVLLQNPHCCQIVMVPSHSAGEVRRQQETDRLQREAAAWSEEQLAQVRAKQERLQAWQATEDTPEQLATLPRLRLADISTTPEELPLEKTEIGGIPVLQHQLSTGGIAYITLFFDAECCTGPELSALSYLCSLLCDTRTETHSAEELIRLDRLTCGNLRFNLGIYGDKADCRRKLCVTLSALESKVPEALELVAEILTQSTLDEETAALEILKQNRQQLMEQIIMSGTGTALGRLAAQYYSTGVAGEYSGGFTFYQWMKQQEAEWDWPALSGQLHELLNRVLTRKGLTVSITGDAQRLAPEIIAKLEALLPDGEPAAPVALEPWGVRREGIMVPADIAFAVRGGNFSAQGDDYTGSMQLAGKIISLSYLWNKIRVQGGAYGTGFIVRTNGLVGCYSYRDPNAAGSLDTFTTCGDFLQEYCRTEPDLEGFIIGAVSDGSPLLTPRQRGQAADGMYWQNTGWELRCKRRRELLESTPEQLQALAALFGTTLQTGGICVVGGQQQLEACALDQIFSI